MSRLKEQVSELMVAFKQEMPLTPTVPPARIIKLRALLTLEETAEFLEALGYSDAPGMVRAAMGVIKDDLESTDSSRVDLVGVADAIGDMHVVNEGAALACGIDLGPISDTIHASNMAKVGGPIDPVTGKQRKPDGWQPPDIAEELRRQGWEP
jgi:predicted HAD superfamily Cof-like phosphohydrolase